MIDLVGPRIAARLASAIAGIANGATQAAGEIGSRAGEIESRVEGIGSSPNRGEASSQVPGTDDHELDERPDDSPEKPSDDNGVIDTPLGSKPKTPVPDVGGN